MKKIDCFWEIKNIGKKTIEIDIENYDEIFSLKEIEKDYDYVVIKTKLSGDALSLLQEKKYNFVEMQFSISKVIKKISLNDKLYVNFFKDTEYKKISLKEDLDFLISNIDEDMFNTDRIYLDKNFSKEKSSIRYKNWIINEYQKETEICFIEYKQQKIGFIMFKKEGKKLSALLGGIFNKFKNLGLGILIILGPLKIAEEQGISKVVTKISSNNFEVFKLYNFLDFKVDKLENVFVKHIKEEKKNND